MAVMELYEVGPDDMQFGGNIFGRNAQIEFDLDEYHNATALSIIVRNLEFLSEYHIKSTQSRRISSISLIFILVILYLHNM